MSFCWYFSQEEIDHKTPSRDDGIPLVVETRYRRDGAKFIINASNTLGLRYETPATGVVFFHRFFMIQSFKNFNRWVVAAACLVLAGKVEETPKKCKDILRVTRSLLNDHQMANFGSNPKEELLTHERILLQTIKFDLQVQHPYSFLLKFAKGLKGDKAKMEKLVQMAWTFVNDSLSTSLCLQWEPQAIAVAFLYLAGKLAKYDLQSITHSKSRSWWRQFVDTLDIHDLDTICHQVLDTYGETTDSSASQDEEEHDTQQSIPQLAQQTPTTNSSIPPSPAVPPPSGGTAVAGHATSLHLQQFLPSQHPPPPLPQAPISNVPGAQHLPQSTTGTTIAQQQYQSQVGVVHSQIQTGVGSSSGGTGTRFGLANPLQALQNIHATSKNPVSQSQQQPAVVGITQTNQQLPYSTLNISTTQPSQQGVILPPTVVKYSALNLQQQSTLSSTPAGKGVIPNTSPALALGSTNRVSSISGYVSGQQQSPQLTPQQQLQLSLAQQQRPSPQLTPQQQLQLTLAQQQRQVIQSQGQVLGGTGAAISMIGNMGTGLPPTGIAMTPPPAKRQSMDLSFRQGTLQQASLTAQLPGGLPPISLPSNISLLMANSQSILQQQASHFATNPGQNTAGIPTSVGSVPQTIRAPGVLGGNIRVPPSSIHTPPRQQMIPRPPQQQRGHGGYNSHNNNRGSSGGGWGMR